MKTLIAVEAVEALHDFHLALIEEGFSGEFLEKLMVECSPVIVSYVLNEG